jgi:uncharacterized protein YjeT (DUF2065 family)
MGVVDIDRVIASIAEKHLGLLPHEALRRAGVDRHARQRRIARGQIVKLSPRVSRVAGTAPTELQRVRAGTLDVAGGAFASCETAAWTWSFPGFALRGIEVTAHRTQFRTSTLAYVHRPVLLRPHHVTMWRGIPITSVARTLWDLAPFIHPLRWERLADTLIKTSPSVLRQLHQVEREIGGRGVAGTVLVRTFLSTRPVGIRVAPSGYQARFEEVMAEAGIKGLPREVDAGGHEWIGRFDYRCDVTGALIEIDSAIHHTSPMDVAADAARDAAAKAAGFPEVLRISTEDLFPRPHRVVQAVRQLRTRYANGAEPHQSDAENVVRGEEAG